VGTVIRISPPKSRAEALAGTCLAAFVCLSVPIVNKRIRPTGRFAVSTYLTRGGTACRLAYAKGYEFWPPHRS
jgi:hypothetical protein